MPLFLLILSFRFFVNEDWVEEFGHSFVDELHHVSKRPNPSVDAHQRVSQFGWIQGLVAVSPAASVVVAITAGIVMLRASASSASKVAIHHHLVNLPVISVLSILFSLALLLALLFSSLRAAIGGATDARGMGDRVRGATGVQKFPLDFLEPDLEGLLLEREIPIAALILGRRWHEERGEGRRLWLVVWFEYQRRVSERQTLRGAAAST